jgi:hypothetical protein
MKNSNKPIDLNPVYFKDMEVAEYHKCNVKKNDNKKE